MPGETAVMDIDDGCVGPSQPADAAENAKSPKKTLKAKLRGMGSPLSSAGTLCLPVQ